MLEPPGCNGEERIITSSAQRLSWIPGTFENALREGFDVHRDCKSDRTPNYNCIAWAAGKTNAPWWPIDLHPYFWPPGLSKGVETLDNFLRAFETEGYVACVDASIEPGFEKIAIYVDDNDVPTHAARSLQNGMWTSKLGDEEDIEHATLRVVEGFVYGTAKA
jgi:hypothetical protein